MTISSIQKTKFLETIYKNYFSSGIKLDEEKVLELYSKYFSKNVTGKPIKLSPEIFRSTGFSNVDLVNEKNANALLNIENLYDVIFENSEELFDVTNALNNKIEFLKKRRTELEAKIDDLLFANQNADGYYYSITENFATGKQMDYSLSTAFLDTNAGKVTVPKITSAAFDLISTNSIVSPDVRYSLNFNRDVIHSAKVFDDTSFFGSVFDGLNNTEWYQTFEFDSIGVVTLSINIPINQYANISKIEGKLNMVTPADIYVKINYANDEFESEVKSKKSSTNFDVFSFDFSPGIVSSIDLIMSKVDPDYINESSSKMYQYRFGIRDITISGQYYDKSGIYISNPYTPKTKDNKNLVIDAVSVAVEENSSNGLISYFVAESTGNETSISDFSWIPIAKPFDLAASFSSTVSFNGSNVESKSIVDTVTNENSQLAKIAIVASSPTVNINEENPTSSLYSGNPIYRIARIDKYENPYSSYILEGINTVSGKYVTYTSSIYNEREKLATWTSLINGFNNDRQVIDIPDFNLTKDPVFFTGLNLSQVSIILPFNLYSPSDNVVSHKFVKNDKMSLNWDVSVHVNDTRYTIPKGVSSDIIEWRFKQGINKIVIAIDCPMSSYEAQGASAKGSISLMESNSILNYGIVYNNYYSYVDPLELRHSRNEYDKVFSIDNVFGNSEIVSRKNIKSNSKIFYFTNSSQPVNSIRFRADLNRSVNPLSSPALLSYSIKFKNSTSFADASSELLKNNGLTN